MIVTEGGSDAISSTERTLKTLVAGGVAGVIAKTAVAPIDRVKILVQANHKHYKYLSNLAAFNKVYRHDGITGFFKGNGAQMIRIIPYAALQFLVYELSKQYLEERCGQTGYVKFLAGSCAGLVAASATYPLDVARTRIAFQATGPVSHHGTINTIWLMFTREGGTAALYKGLSPTLIGMIPYGGFSFWAFESLKYNLLEYLGKYSYVAKPCPKNDGQLVLTIIAKLFCGAVAGCLAQTVAYPLDVVRRKMQLANTLPNAHEYRSWIGAFKYVYKKNGMKNGLFRGVSLTYFKAVPMVSISFCVYEKTKERLGLESHDSAS